MSGRAATAGTRPAPPHSAPPYPAAAPAAAAFGSVDARTRLLAAAAFAVVVVACHDPAALVAGLALALAAAAAFRPDWRGAVRRLLAMDALILLMILMLPFTVPGEPAAQLGPLTASREGVAQAVAVALKAHAVVLALLALVGTLDTPELGVALARLRVPDRLVQLLMFTLRYLDVLEREYRRLRRAMAARAFRPRSDCHTWRSFGLVFGMLLVRSHDRAERILAAMKCRGFTGRFHRPAPAPWARRDIAFGLVWGLALGALIWLETA